MIMTLNCHNKLIAHISMFKPPRLYILSSVQWALELIGLLHPPFKLEKFHMKIPDHYPL